MAIVLCRLEDAVLQKKRDTGNSGISSLLSVVRTD